MPDLDAEIDAALRDSIERFGVLVPIVVDQHGAVIDGHNRLRFAEELGISAPSITREVASEAEALELAATLNMDRRHMDPTTRATIAASLRERGHSLRAIAGALGVDHKTVFRDLGSPSLVGNESTPRSGDEAEQVVGTNGVAQPAQKIQWTDDQVLALLDRREAGEAVGDIAASIDRSTKQTESLLTRARKIRKGEDPLKRVQHRSAAHWAEQMTPLVEQGFTSRQIADHLGLGEEYVRKVARQHDITITADAVIGRARHIDSNRIVGETVHTLEGAVMGVGLVDFDDLDRDQIAGWVTSLSDSLRSLNQLNKRLKEMTRDEA